MKHAEDKHSPVRNLILVEMIKVSDKSPVRDEIDDEERFIFQSIDVYYIVPDGT